MGMTIDGAIRHCREVAEEQDKLCKRYDDASGYTRSHNEDIRTTDAKKCIECAAEHRQLAEWLKKLATIADMLDGTIDHLSGDDAKELLNDIKWELRGVEI